MIEAHGSDLMQVHGGGLDTRSRVGPTGHRIVLFQHWLRISEDEEYGSLCSKTERDQL